MQSFWRGVLCLMILSFNALIGSAQVAGISSEPSVKEEDSGTGGAKSTGKKRYPKAIVMRGPYLQQVRQNAANLRWRTNAATDSRLEVGTGHGAYTLSAYSPAPTTEHEVRIEGLKPGTRYYYRIGSSSHWLQAGKDNYFTTAPADTTTQKIRVAVFGDAGRNNKGYRRKSLRAYRDFVQHHPAELMLLLGDNAYFNGRDREYQARFFAPFGGTILKNHALFPALGNHDYGYDHQRQRDHNIAYFSIFSLPRQGECGGVPSGSEAFYSYDWGNIHFIVLDSYGRHDGGFTKLYDTLGAQVRWLKRDLQANRKQWTVAYWHHPPHSMGSHNSDVDQELSLIRENLSPILERYGVDMVLSGHSHNYERSFPLQHYYDKEACFDASVHAASTSNGRYDGKANSCAYVKKSGTGNRGTIYVVAGSSGAAGKVQEGYPHNALPFALNDGGMFYFEVEGNRLDAKFIRQDGKVADQFTMFKDVNRQQVLSVAPGQTIELTASWAGDYRWSNGASARTIRVAPASDSVYTVTDDKGCVRDEFVVRMDGAQIPKP